jgi:hypothetical protein
MGIYSLGISFKVFTVDIVLEEDIKTPPPIEIIKNKENASSRN